jgi:hypothetical protein
MPRLRQDCKANQRPLLMLHRCVQSNSRFLLEHQTPLTQWKQYRSQRISYSVKRHHTSRYYYRRAVRYLPFYACGPRIHERPDLSTCCRFPDIQLWASQQVGVNAWFDASTQRRMLYFTSHSYEPNTEEIFTRVGHTRGLFVKTTRAVQIYD